ncbi:hypothetical protein BASA81_000586 [Batrachochytrium salamandrivorans]|nr:hypothetical protein BASA81_000586 [Batrachochytrium salamandrivorans]
MDFEETIHPMLRALGGAGRFYCRSPQRRADQQQDMLSCFRGVRAAGREDRPSLGEGDKIMPRDEALERFDQLRVREVSTYDYPSASAFLAEFQSIAASLEPDERIKLKVAYTREDVELLKAVLSDPQASKICSLKWYDGKKDVNSVAPLLTNSCPELASLEVLFDNHSAFGFVSGLLEHPSNKLKELVMLDHHKGASARLFAALGQSQVSALALRYPSRFSQNMREYLAKDLLVRLKVWMGHEQVPPEMIMSLSKCTRLAELQLTECRFSQLTAFPKFITKFELKSCMFVGRFDWSFLIDSNVRELDLLHVSGVDGNQLGNALAVRLRAKGLDKLRFYYCGFVNETLAKVGVEIGRIKRFEGNSHLNAASIALIALTLQSPNNEMKELKVEYTNDTVSSIENHLVPALKHPNCNLAKLFFWAYEPEHEEVAKRMENALRNRRALFALLQGKQVRRRSSCPLRRLPVEMLRLVGKSLI